MAAGPGDRRTGALPTRPPELRSGRRRPARQRQFPLNDTDRALALLSQTLPVRLQSFTRYWLQIVPA
ncbi:hypothetical protein NFX37_13690 [Serratia marcescens]|nr:hypothetical protein NFX37_13690 [Serratia marcescens]